MKKTRNGMSWAESAKLAGEASKKRKSKREEEYDKDPKICELCYKTIHYDKRNNRFCSKSCSCSFNNKGVRRNQSLGTKIKRNCLFCHSETINKKYCSNECLSKYVKKNRKELIIKNKELVTNKDKWFLEETRGKKCESCCNEKWLDEEIPLDMHHIDGDSDNNKLDNLQLLCPNCHRATDNHGSKNKNGRYSKRKGYRNNRYKNGLSY